MNDAGKKSVFLLSAGFVYGIMSGITGSDDPDRCGRSGRKELAMAQKYCPECRHELAGLCRFCQFCGCDLKKNPRIVVSRNDGKEGTGWDPEAYNAASSAKKIILLIGILALAAMIFTLYSSLGIGNTQSVQITREMSFEEADQAMIRNGFRPDGAATHYSLYHTRQYVSGKAYGYTTLYSELVFHEGGGISVAHYIQDDAGSSLEKPGRVFAAIRSELVKKYGEPLMYPSENDSYPVWYIDDRFIVMTYFSGNIIAVGEVIE